MLVKPIPRHKLLTLFQVIMINIIAVDSIRNLPFSASYGFALIFFYLLASLLFFIPGALVSAELGTGWPSRGGLYVWVREAFGLRASMMTIWLNWIYNIFWFPTIIALIAGTFAYFFDPQLAQNKFFMSAAVVILFWLITLVNCFGMKISGHFSALSSVVGTLLPMGLLIILGIWWVATKQPSQVPFTWANFFPSKVDYGNLAFLTNVLFGLIGLEMAAAHAEEMVEPSKTYPRSIFISVLIIIGTTVLSSLTIAIVVPHKDLNLVVGTMQAFSGLVDQLGSPWLIPFLAAFIILGGLGGAAAWVIGPSKGMMMAARDGTLPRFMTRMTKDGVPINILLLQGVVVSLLSIAFVSMPSVNSAYWLLSNVTGQLALTVYIILFLSAIRLHHKKPHIVRSFKIPGGRYGVWIVCTIGTLTCLTVIGVGFVPPTHFSVGKLWIYELSMIGASFLFAVVPILLLQWRYSYLQRKKKTFKLD